MGFAFWAWLTCIIGARILPGAETKSDTGELLRTLGFANSPGVLLVFAVIPPLAPFIFPICGVWMLTAMVIAVRQALDYTNTWRAVGACAIGWVVQALILGVVYAMFGAG